MSVNVSPSVPANIASFIRNFYAVSDDESKHDEYVNSFVSQGVHFQIGPMKPATEPSGILAWRHKGWEPVAKRTHTIHDVFVHGEKGDQFMLHGQVDYKLKDGSDGSAIWGGWMTFEDPKSSSPKMKKYVVWLTPQ